MTAFGSKPLIPMTVQPFAGEGARATRECSR